MSHGRRRRAHPAPATGHYQPFGRTRRPYEPGDQPAGGYKPATGMAGEDQAILADAARRAGLDKALDARDRYRSADRREGTQSPARRRLPASPRLVAKGGMNREPGNFNPDVKLDPSQVIDRRSSPSDRRSEGRSSPMARSIPDPLQAAKRAGYGKALSQEQGSQTKPSHLVRAQPRRGKEISARKVDAARRSGLPKAQQAKAPSVRRQRAI